MTNDRRDLVDEVIARRWPNLEPDAHGMRRGLRRHTRLWIDAIAPLVAQHVAAILAAEGERAEGEYKRTTDPFDQGFSDGLARAVELTRRSVKVNEGET